MGEKRFQKTRIVDKWGGIYDSETDEVLNVDDVEHKLNEQQATIRRLQDLCGQSDGENAKLRIENKRLQEEIERLQKKIDNISNSYEKFYGVKLKYAHWLQGDD